MKPPAYPLFSRFGVELEYMIVQRRTLDIRPLADRLIERETGRIQSDVSRGALEWSNELALHVIEFKTGRPTPQLDGLADRFQSEIRHVNGLLHGMNARLLPTAMHPWMDPHRESRLWPHDCHEIYETFDRIFGCRGHGWTNLQSVHLNLPFANDQEFGRLHAAIRLCLPLLPALAASSPFVEGRRAPSLDMRLEVYQHNCDRVPSVTAGVIPESIRSAASYQRRILRRIDRDIRPLDPEGILEPEWTNARGAIARFCRNTIEVRVLDVQECPAVDLGIIAFLVEILRALTRCRWSAWSQQLRVPTVELQGLLRRTLRRGRHAPVDSPSLLKALGLGSRRRVTVGKVLRHLAGELAPSAGGWYPTVEMLLTEGSLAERILKRTGPTPERSALRATYGDLARCLQEGRVFMP